MKKFFAFLFGAATLLTACGEDPIDGGGNGNGNGGDDPIEENFYPVAFDQAEVINRGDFYNDGTNSYIINMYRTEGGNTVGFAMHEIITPEVNDGVIPEGKYTIADGTLAEGAFTSVLEGTYYIRNYADDGYFQLATEGWFEVKHLANGGYQFSSSIKGIDLNDGSPLPLNESRFEGQPTMMGLPASNNYSVYTPVHAQATYIPVADGIVGWQILLADGAAVQGGYPYHISQFVLLAEDNGPEVLPQGSFPIDYLGLQTLGSQMANVNVIGNSENDVTEDPGVNGTLTIKAQGEGKYSIEAVTFGAAGAYKQSYNGKVVLIDNSKKTYDIIAAQANFGGAFENGNYWTLYLIDQKNDSIFWLYVNTPADNTFAAGIPSGSYVVADTSEPGTIDVGYVGSDNYVYGSMISDLAQEKVKNLVTGGELDVVNNGDGTYGFAFEFLDMDQVLLYGEYEGEVYLVDNTKPVELEIDNVLAEWGGLGLWLVHAMDTTNDLMLNLYVFLSEDSAMTDGVPSGTYPVTDTAEPGTIFLGFQDPDDGGLYGSLVTNVAYSSAYDFIVGGQAEITQNSLTNYTFNFEFEGVYDNYAGSYSGDISVNDATAVAPSKAKAIEGMKLAPKAGEKEMSGMQLAPIARYSAVNF